MNAMIPMYVYTSNFVADRVDAVKDRYKNKDRGAGLVEYAGLVVLAAVVLGAIFIAFQKSDFRNKLQSTITGIFTSHSIANGS